jgi:hypothetical protein
LSAAIDTNPRAPRSAHQPGAPIMRTRIRDILFACAFGLALGALIAAGI